MARQGDKEPDPQPLRRRRQRSNDLPVARRQVSNIMTFAERYHGVQQVRLADNFRSSKVVEPARSVADRIPRGLDIRFKREQGSSARW